MSFTDVPYEPTISARLGVVLLHTLSLQALFRGPAPCAVITGPVPWCCSMLLFPVGAGGRLPRWLPHTAGQPALLVTEAHPGLYLKGLLHPCELLHEPTGWHSMYALFLEPVIKETGTGN